MLWYRHRPHEAYHGPVPSLDVQHQLCIAWCCRVKGFTNGRQCLCNDCYILLNNSSFTGFYTHLIFNGYGSPTLGCDNCHVSLMTVNPFEICQLCSRVHLNYLGYNPGTVFRDEPTLIYVNGYNILFLKE